MHHSVCFHLSLKELEYWLKCYKEFKTSYTDLKLKFPPPPIRLPEEAKETNFFGILTSRAKWIKQAHYRKLGEWERPFRKKLAETVDDFVKKYGRGFCFRIILVHDSSRPWRREIEEVDGVTVWWLKALDSSYDYIVDGYIDKQISFVEGILKPKKSVIRAREKVAEIEERADRRLKKRRQDKALLASAAGTSRNLAASIKRKLVKGHPCPYCGKSLGSDFHADHIYPVIKGGLSTIQNMVNVCSSCNLAKGDLTLSAFIRKLDLNRNEIESRLENLGKEF